MFQVYQKPQEPEGKTWEITMSKDQIPYISRIKEEKDQNLNLLKEWIFLPPGVKRVLKYPKGSHHRPGGAGQLVFLVSTPNLDCIITKQPKHPFPPQGCLSHAHPLKRQIHRGEGLSNGMPLHTEGPAAPRPWHAILWEDGRIRTHTCWPLANAWSFAFPQIIFFHKPCPLTLWNS